MTTTGRGRPANVCPVCRREYEQNAHGSKLLCSPCFRSLKAAGSSQFDIIAWAAKRAHFFAAKEPVEGIAREQLAHIVMQKESAALMRRERAEGEAAMALLRQRIIDLEGRCCRVEGCDHEGPFDPTCCADLGYPHDCGPSDSSVTPPDARRPSGRGDEHA